MRTVGSGGYLLQEYGSWSVLIVSFLIGVCVSRMFVWQLFPLLIALGLLINSKQAFTKWIRGTKEREALFIFLAQALVSGVLVIAVFGTDIFRLLPLLVFPAAYLLSNKLAREHAVVTELLGFTLISLAAVLAKFLLTGGLDVRLFLGVSFYFMAGVFKIKTLLLRTMRYRILTVLYMPVAWYVYYRMHVPRIILLPLLENLLAAVVPYRVRLRTTGWIEVAKSLVVLALFAAYY